MIYDIESTHPIHLKAFKEFPNINFQESDYWARIWVHFQKIDDLSPSIIDHISTYQRKLIDANKLLLFQIYYKYFGKSSRGFISFDACVGKTIEDYFRED